MNLYHPAAFHASRTTHRGSRLGSLTALQFVKVDDYTWEWHSVATTSELASGYRKLVNDPHPCWLPSSPVISCHS